MHSTQLHDTTPIPWDICCYISEIACHLQKANCTPVNQHALR